MITEDYVSFETAKLLKEKGFNEYCRTIYNAGSFCSVASLDCRWNEGYGELIEEKQNSDFGAYDNSVSAPTLQMAMKWLREVHHWHIFVIPKFEDVEYMPGEWQEEMVGYQYVIISVGEVNRKNNQPIITALTPESAYEAAIKYCLENLI